MIAAEATALVLLAAGRSRRFGAADKLAAPLEGLPLGLHIVEALAVIPFARRVGVVSGTHLDLAGRGYEVVVNPAPEAGLSGSLRLGVDHAIAPGVEAILIVLADMPRITAAHVMRLLDLAEGASALVASTDGTAPRPPALFGRDHFAALRSATGDAGMRDLIHAGRLVTTGAHELADVDTVEDLAEVART